MSKKTRENDLAAKTLSNDDITTVSTKGRRAFIRQIGMIGLGGATVVMGAATAKTRDNTGTSDNGQLPHKKKNNE